MQGRDQEGDPQTVARILSDQKSQTNWQLSSRRISNEQLQLLFESLRPHSEVRTMKLEWNHMPSIITLITLPSFPALKSLNLGANNLTTLEPIIQLKADNLQQIFLWNNHITDLRVLRKGNLPRLRLIDLSKNNVIQLGRLSEGCFGGLQWVNFDLNQLGCLSPICKVKGFTLHGTLLAADSLLVGAFGVLTKRGRAYATNFAFQNNLPPQVSFF